MRVPWTALPWKPVTCQPRPRREALVKGDPITMASPAQWRRSKPGSSHLVVVLLEVEENRFGLLCVGERERSGFFGARAVAGL